MSGRDDFILPTPEAPRLPGVSPRNTFVEDLIALGADKTEAHGAWLYAERRRLEKELKPLISEHTRMYRTLQVYERMMQRTEKAQFRNHDGARASVLKLRKQVKNAEDFGRENEREAISQMLRAMWFDFRSFAHGWDKDVADFGRELVSEGLLRLPFDKCVFVLPYLVDGTGERLSVAYYLENVTSGISVKGTVYVPSVERPACFADPEICISQDEIYFVLAAMASRAAVISQRRTLDESEAKEGEHDTQTTYTEVIIRPSYHSEIAGGGHHASPRLHWRRGHIRRLSERKTWVRATLVGDAGRGIVLHDYSGRPLDT